MQTTDANSLLQIMQSPMGAALLPLLADREKMVMDQSNATLSDTLSRTQINQDGNRRSNEMHPLQMGQARAETAHKQVKTGDEQFDLDVKQGLGKDFFMDAKKREGAKAELEMFNKTQSSFANVAGMISKTPSTAPGATRALAIDLLKRSGQPQTLLDNIAQWPEDQIGKRLGEMATDMAKFSRQFIQQDAALTSREGIAEKKNLTSIRVAEIQALARQRAAEIASRSRSSGNQRAPKLEELAAFHKQEASKTNDPETKLFHDTMADQFMELKRRGAPSATATASSIVPDGRGGVGIGQRERNPAPTPMPSPSVPQLPASQNPTAPTKANSANLPSRVMSAEDYLKQFPK